MEKTQWMPPNTHPTRRGLYERDWTHTDILPIEDRRVSMDFWQPVWNPRDSLYPGVWYVLPEFNDASRQHLPWRGLERPNANVTGLAPEGDKL
jgi:hypothetical protein